MKNKDDDDFVEEPPFNVAVQAYSKNTNGRCKAGDTAEVNYTGKLTNGQIFDSSIKRDDPEPISFVLGQ